MIDDSDYTFEGVQNQSIIKKLKRLFHDEFFIRSSFKTVYDTAFVENNLSNALKFHLLRGMYLKIFALKKSVYLRSMFRTIENVKY